MALDERYFTALNLEEFFIDNTTGEPLAGGTIEFWKDNDRSTPKNVYQLSGSPPNYTYSVLPNPVTLSGVGTVVNGAVPAVNTAIYYYPYDANGDIELYYIVVKDSSGNVQLRREGWPNLTAADDPTKTENSISNEISNSQFVDVLFDADYGLIISESGSVTDQAYSIAPNWDIVLSTNGAATVTINRTAVAGSLNYPTNPPYTLDILAGGGNLTSLKLRQRLNHNPDIWANGYLAGHMVVSSLDGSPHTITMNYAPSVAPADTVIVTGSTGSSGYVELNNTIELDAGNNTDTANTGYVDIEIILPVSGEYNITSVQVCGLNTNEQDVHYDQEPVNRQEDHLFNYYNPILTYKPISSYLVGWNFPYNPNQINGNSVGTQAIGAGKSYYTWDQTIMYQSANSGITISKQGDMYRATAAATTQMAIVQYMTGRAKSEILRHNLSVALRGFSSQVAGISGTVSIWYTTDASLPDLNSPNYNSIVATLDANGKVATTNGTWTEMTRPGRGDARFTLTSTIFNEIYLNGWQALTEAEYSGATHVAIVIGFESMTAAQYVEFQNITMCPGDLATVSPATSSYEETQNCYQFYLINLL